MKKALRFVLICFFVLTPLSAWAQQATAPVVVELFTSQGCSSCPKADAVLAQIAAKPNVIALGCHVTYWDQIGWKDTLALPLCTQRQAEYAQFLGRGAHVYTPQMIVNGAAQFNGGDRNAAETVIQSGGGQVVLPINITPEGEAGLRIQLPYLPVRPSGAARLLIFSYKNQSDVAISSGENGGRNISYTHPVLALDEGEEWAGNARDVSFTPSNAAADGYAVIAQDAETGRIIAAGKITRTLSSIVKSR